MSTYRYHTLNRELNKLVDEIRAIHPAVKQGSATPAEQKKLKRLQKKATQVKGQIDLLRETDPNLDIKLEREHQLWLQGRVDPED